MVDLRFIRPVRPGDTITFNGEVTGTFREANGLRVNVKIEAQNQRGDTTGVGSGSAVVPRHTCRRKSRDGLQNLTFTLPPHRGRAFVITPKSWAYLERKRQRLLHYS